MSDFLNRDEPNFVFKGINALVDMGCVIEKELPDVKAQPNIEELTIIGRNGSLTEWYGDYKPYDLDVGKISIPYERLEEVKRWLSGNGKLITHNDVDKYIEAIPKFSTDFVFDNEWGEFYSFELSFRCQPLKRKVNEQPLVLNMPTLTFFNAGTENSYPKIEFNNSGNIYFKVICNETELIVPNLVKGPVTIDCDKGLVIQNGNFVRSIGEWPVIIPGHNKVSIYGDYTEAKLFMRSAWT